MPETSGDVLADAETRHHEALVRTRKRFARRQWARRVLAWRPILLLVLLLALVAGVVWLFFSSSVFAVRTVSISGTGLLTDAQVRRAASVPVGEPLASIDIDGIRDRLRALGPVESVEVTRSWPHEVSIVITERTAVAVVQVGTNLKGIDADGVYFRDFPKRPRDLPLITGPADIPRDVLREAATIVGLLPGPVADRVAHIRVETIDQITLVLRDGREVEWGSADQSADKARVLAVLLQHRAEVYDVSVPGQPTTR